MSEEERKTCVNAGGSIVQLESQKKYVLLGFMQGLRAFDLVGASESATTEAARTQESA